MFELPTSDKEQALENMLKENIYEYVKTYYTMQSVSHKLENSPVPKVEEK